MLDKLLVVSLVVFGRNFHSSSRVRIVPPVSILDEVLLAVSDQIRYDKLSLSLRMKKTVVVFLKGEPLDHSLMESGAFSGIYMSSYLHCQSPQCGSLYLVL